jgi:hypothetical protein
MTVPEVTKLREEFRALYRSQPDWDYDLYSALDKALFRLIGEDRPDILHAIIEEMFVAFLRLIVE